MESAIPNINKCSMLKNVESCYSENLIHIIEYSNTNTCSMLHIVTSRISRILLLIFDYA